ncbi:DUF6350 family protein [Streptomyces sp. TRM 70361]|uniref:cell division protein PerM n=1 Tax=Streptomyces sp. TRM 70361 TaxID=3116553 RepID=UPI002E7C2F56|nr:DUF6350 family protein [Streptomyces sp. TRM 70361]MEE1939433.1 DUF6350 family protein [Streptomyces sp. TRM 70361]
MARHGTTPSAHRPSGPPGPGPDRRAPDRPAERLLEGVMAAGLGLAGITVVVLLLWTTSPCSDGGPGDALRIAADLWLMAHGAPLVRVQTLSGAPAPVGLTPLLLCAVPLWLLYRAARDATAVAAGEPHGEPAGSPADRTVVDGSRPWRAAGWVVTGYLLVAAAATGYASAGPLRVDPLGAAPRLPAVVAAVAAAGAWTGLGRPMALPRRAPRCARRVPAPVRALGRLSGRALGAVAAVLTRPGAVAVPRAAAAGTAALCAAGGLLTAGALLWRTVSGDGAQPAVLPETAPGCAGHAALLLLCLALAPNAAVWGASYGLGPGFTLGGGSEVGPGAVTALPRLPDFPLLAALPAEGPGTPLTWAVAGAVPLAAGVVTARSVARAAVPERGRQVLGGCATACAAVLAACGCGAAMALLAAWSGGPLGNLALAHLGPHWWLTGAAALGWTAALGVPGALALRARRLRRGPAV